MHPALVMKAETRQKCDQGNTTAAIQLLQFLTFSRTLAQIYSHFPVQAKQSSKCLYMSCSEPKSQIYLNERFYVVCWLFFQAKWTHRRSKVTLVRTAVSEHIAIHNCDFDCPQFSLSLVQPVTFSLVQHLVPGSQNQPGLTKWHQFLKSFHVLSQCLFLL